MKKDLCLFRLGVCVFILVTGLFFVSGCTEMQLRSLADQTSLVSGQVTEISQAVSQAEYSQDNMLNLLRAFEVGNAASVGFNPYALPIGAGLSGIIAMLEALRRKEKSSRKHAEYQLSNGNGSNGNGRSGNS